MFSWLTLESVKALFSKFSLKGILIAIVLAIAAFGVWKAYDWALDRGKAEQAQTDKKTIDGLNQKVTEADNARDAAIKLRDEYIAQYNTWRDGTKAAQDQLIEDQKATIAQLNKELDKIPAIQQANTRLQNEVSKYISAATDRSCIVPLGLVRLHNQSLLPETSSPDYLAAGTGPRSDDGAPSGITCSDFASVIVFNNGEAVTRGIILKQWDTWWDKYSASLDAAAKAEAAAIPKE